MTTFKVGETIYDLPEDKVKEFKDTFPDAVEVTDPEEGKTNGVAEEGATVTPTTGPAPEIIDDTGAPEVTGFKPVESSLGSKWTDNFVELEGVQFDDGAIGLGAIELEGVTVTADQYKKVEQDIENEGAKQVDDQVIAMSPGDISGLVKFLSDKGKDLFGNPEKAEDISTTASLYGTTVNSLVQLSGVDDRANYVLSAFTNQIPDDVFLNILGEDAGRRAIQANRDYFKRTNEQYDYINSLNLPTLGFTDIGKKEGLSKVGTGLAATLNGISAFATSAVTAGATGGIGLATDIGANAIKSFNDTKAQSLGITTEELFASGQGEILIPSSIAVVQLALERLGLKKVGDYFNKLPAGKTKGLFSLLNVGNAEAVPEYFQGGLDVFNEGLAQGLSIEDASEKFLDYLTSPDGIENYLQGLVGGSGIAGIGSAARKLRTDKDNEAISKIIRDLNDLENSKFRKNLTAEDIAGINTAQEELRFNLTQIIDKSNALAGTLSDAQIEELNANSDFLTSSADRINEIEASNEFTQKDKEVLLQTIEQQREIASQNIFDIRSEAEKFYSNLFNVRAAAEKRDDVKVLDFANADEIQTYLNDNPDLVAEGGRIAASGEQGFFIPGVGDGPGTIIINREKSLDEKAVNVASHEFLHYVLDSTLKNNPAAAINLGNALLRELDKIDVNKIKDSNFKKRMELYKDDKVEIQMEEALTLFSDALATGDIQLNEDISTMLGDRFRRVLGRVGVKVKFNKGSDVVNFVKDFNKSLEKGVLTKAQQAVAEEGAEGELIPQAEQQADEQQVKASRTISPRGKEFIELAKEGVFTNESLVETIKSPSSTAEDKFGAIEAIVENNFPVISKAIQFNPTGSIPMDAVKEAVTEQIQGIFPGRNTALFDTYNPETSKVTTFIDTRLGPRQAEILERAQAIGGTTQAVDITEARGIAVEETKPASTRGKALAKKPTETVVYSDEVLSNVGAANTEALENRITEEIQTAFKGKDISRFKELKDIPKNITQLYADMFGLSTVDGIVDFKRNFPKLDEGAVRNIRTFLNRNAEDDFRRLPKTKDDQKRATGIKQTKLGKVMYDANDNLVGTLKQYKDILQGKNITLPAYDGEMIEFNRIVDGKKLPIYRDSQHYKAALKFHIQNRIAEDVMPDKAQRLSAGLKFAKATKPDLTTIGSFGKATRMSTGSLSRENKITPIERGSVKYIGSKGTEKTETRWKLTKKEQEELPIFLNSVAPLFGEDFFTTGNFAFGQRSLVGRAENLKDALRNAKYNDKAPAMPKRFKYKKLTPSEIKSKIKEKSFIENQEKLLPYLKFVFKQIETDLKQNPQHLKYWEAVINDAQNSQDHFMRFLAPFKFYSLIDGPVVEEHSLPQSNVGYFLLEAALNGKVDQYFPFISDNYFQGALLESDDKKTRGKGFNYISSMPEIFFEVENPTTWLRYLNENVSNTNGGINPNNYSLLDGRTLAEFFNAQVPQGALTPSMVSEQQKQIEKKLKDPNYNPQPVLQEFGKISRSIYKASKSNNKKLPPGISLEDPNSFDRFGMVDVVAKRKFPKQTNVDAVKSGFMTPYEALSSDEKIEVIKDLPGIKFSKSPSNKQVLDLMSTSDQAIKFARNADAPNKGISVWDFDDTLATTKSNVLYTMPDGTEGKLTAEQFAKQGEQLLEEGAEFDFSEFEKVTKGAKGPMFEKAVARNRKFGNDNVFILTARTQAAAEPIHQFLKAIGLDIPLKNIVGLGNSTPEAKARWVVGKAAEGYNDFYFADDAYKNVKAVQDALSVLDVKSKVRQAYIKHSKSEALDKGFNDILEQTTGIASEKEYKKVKAEVAGASLGRVFRGIPYSAQDFVGLLYETLSKGKLGDSQMAWYKKHLIDPYARAVNDIDNARLSVMQDYRALKKQLGFVPKNLRKKVPGEPFTREQAVRVYIWNNLGYDVPGISKQDLKELTEYVFDNADLQVFADQVIAIQKGEYAKPKEGWPAGTITTDIQESINTGVRAKYLTQWQNNVDVIFSEKNMNKLEAAYGKKYRKAMENMLERMKTGRNRRFSDDSLTGRFTDWLQGSIGAIMFFNSRSALLQNLSSINFLNFTDNNPLAAARAFANQKQYWSDFSKLINSDFLKARRSGLRMNVNEADIADMAKKGGPRAVISKLLQFGFTPTQIADSFAIASGGATFYRNRIKSLMKQGMSQAEAETKAFEDFRETAEESQQSARPDRISMQQAGPLGRLILAFQNTPSQYARIIDKAVRDLKNRRGDAKTNISKIVYYATVQNLIFNALQQALFAMAFDDEEPEDEEKKEKYVNILNSMADSLLRGTGVAGGVMSVTKNAVIRIIRESQKDNPNYEKVGADLQRIAPPVSSKLSKINQAARSFKWDKDEMINGGWGLDNPAYLAVGNVVSATTNIPMDRGVKKINNLMKASDSELETWERLALFGGWQDWEIGLDEEKKKTQKRKVKKRKVKKRKVKK